MITRVSFPGINIAPPAYAAVHSKKFEFSIKMPTVGTKPTLIAPPAKRKRTQDQN